MILADTSVWIDHLRKGSAALSERLQAGEIVSHPLIIGELACGGLRRRARFLSDLRNLPLAPLASEADAFALLDQHRLCGRGLGWIDIHLLASARLGRVRLWTRDGVLAGVARLLRVGVNPDSAQT